MTARDLLKGVSEAAFQAQVIELATKLGWLVHAERPAMRQSGKWSTPIQGHKGFPDLVMARDGHLVFAELKRVGGRRTLEQEQWLTAIGFHNCRIWRGVWTPEHWDEIEAVLR